MTKSLGRFVRFKPGLNRISLAAKPPRPNNCDVIMVARVWTKSSEAGSPLARARACWSGAVLMVVIACSGQHSQSAALGAAQQTRAADAASVPSRTNKTGKRWLFVPPPDVVEHSLQLGQKAHRHFTADGLRARVGPNGNLAHAEQRLGFDRPRVVELPNRLGGGFVFYGESDSRTELYRAKTWLGPLEPLLQLNHDVEEIHAGFRTLLLRLSDGRLVPLELDSKSFKGPSRLPAAPSYRTIAFASDRLGAAMVDVLGVLITNDGGENWQRTQWTNPIDAKLSVLDEKIVLQSLGGNVVLGEQSRSIAEVDANDDNFRPLNTALDAYREPETPAQTSQAGLPLSASTRVLNEHLSLFARAVTHGVPYGEDSVVHLEHGKLYQFALADGALLVQRSNAYRGSRPCAGLALGDGRGFVCSETGSGTTVIALAKRLALRTVAKFPGSRNIIDSGNGSFVVQGGCEDASAAETSKDPATQYCVYHPKKGLLSVATTGGTGSERVVALRDGRVALLSTPTADTTGQLTIVRGGTSSTVRLRQLQSDHPWKARARTAQWLEGFEQSTDQTLSGWIADGDSFIGVSVSLDGGYTLSAPNDSLLAATTFHRGHALEVRAAPVSIESEDFGFTWNNNPLPESVAPATAKAGTNRRSACGEVGCVFGNWVRVSSSPEAASALPTDPGSLPRRSILLPSYSEWRLECALQATQATPKRMTQRELARLESRPARLGSRRGFAAPLLGTAPRSEIVSSSFAPFAGMASPRSRPSESKFDIGSDGELEFRAFAWGAPNKAWNESSRWVVRGINRFELAGVWSTEPTRPPWSGYEASARNFGSDRRDHYSGHWALYLDPEEQSGILRISRRGNTELHLLRKGKAIESIGSVPFGRLHGVVSARKAHYFGVVDGDLFRVMRWSGGDIAEVAELPIEALSFVELTRSMDGDRLGILRRSMSGEWFIYSLDAELSPSAPLHFTREMLNRKSPPCDDTAEGWLIQSGAPLTRKSRSNRASVDFTKFPRMKTKRLSLQVIAAPDKLCVYRAAAELTIGKLPTEPMPNSSLPYPSFPMVVTDRATRARSLFRCTP